MNTATSPTGFRNVCNFGGPDVCTKFIEKRFTADNPIVHTEVGPDNQAKELLRWEYIKMLRS
jgi:hypothetical protein